jgi:hydroxyethylthiazole kinase
VAAATAAYTIAAEMAAESVAGSGSFAVRLLDALGTLDGDSVRRRLALA